MSILPDQLYVVCTLYEWVIVLNSYLAKVNLKMLVLFFCKAVDFNFGDEYIMQDVRPCAGCGLTLPHKIMKKIKESNSSALLYCKLCAKVFAKYLV